MSVKIYENGAWVDKAPRIYKDGAWVNATSVKVYENGAWVEKLINYNNMTISLIGNGFAQNASNYISCNANNITMQIARSKTDDTTVKLVLIPPSTTNHFGKAPVLTYGLYAKNSNPVNSDGAYGYVTSYAGATRYSSTDNTYRTVLANKDAQEISISAYQKMDMTNSYSELVNVGSIRFEVTVAMASNMTIGATTYIEITDIAVNGIPYGVNTTIKP